MDFGFTDEQERFRLEVKDFCLLEPRGKKVPQDVEEAYAPEFYKKLAAKGWIGMHWPKKYGGQGRSWVDLVIFAETAYLAGAPLGAMTYGTTVGCFGDFCLSYGSEQQKKEYLPRIAKGEIRVARAFTEPDAGHDLAAVQTRAVRDGDSYVINGQKTYISGAHVCDYMFLMTRTDDSGPKEKGISFFIVDLKSPGITVRPLWALNDTRTNEVFLDNVRVPAENLIGKENQGWDDFCRDPHFRYVMGIGGAMSSQKQILTVCMMYSRTAVKNGRPLIEDPLVRHRLAEMKIKNEFLRLLVYQVASMRDKGQMAEYQLYMIKLLEGEVWQRLIDIGMTIFGVRGQLGFAKHAIFGGMMGTMYRTSPIMFLPGSPNTLRNGIASWGLGMTESGLSEPALK